MSTASAPCRTLLSSWRSASRAERRAQIPFSQRKRSYFSVHHPDPPPFPEIHDRILSAGVGQVPKYGFTKEALVMGAKEAGYLDVSVQLFPRGAFDLIQYYLATQRLALKNKVQFPTGAQLGLGTKVRTLAMARLRANADTIHQWQGVRFGIVPSSACFAKSTVPGTRIHVPP
jgi:ubiquinone biosynthesis protein COQ9